MAKLFCFPCPVTSHSFAIDIDQFFQGSFHFPEEILCTDPFLFHLRKQFSPLSIQLFCSSASRKLDPLLTVLVAQKFCCLYLQFLRYFLSLFSKGNCPAGAKCPFPCPTGFLVCPAQMLQSLIRCTDAHTGFREFISKERRQVLFFDNIYHSLIHIRQKYYRTVFLVTSFPCCTADHKWCLIKIRGIFLLQKRHFLS